MHITSDSLGFSTALTLVFFLGILLRKSRFSLWLGFVDIFFKCSCADQFFDAFLPSKMRENMFGKGTSNLVVNTVEMVTGWFNPQNSS